MKYFIPFVLLAGVILGSCRSSGKNMLVPDTMKVVMWDMLKIDELYSQMLIRDTALRKTKTNLRLYEEIFALHHITRKQFETTYKFYESHPVQFKVLLDSIEAFAERERARPKVIAAPKKKGS